MNASTPQRPLGCIHGRFQPFHLGHWSYLQQALEKVERIVVAITCPTLLPEPMPEDSDPLRHLPENNPFTYFERCEMVLASAAAAGLERRLIVVPLDINGPSSLWAQTVPFEALQIVTPHDPWDHEKAIRMRAAGYQTVFLPTRENRIRATEVRRRITYSLPWRHLVPSGTAGVIDRYNLAPRLMGEPTHEGKMISVSEALDFWESKHRKYATQNWNALPNKLANLAVEVLPAHSRILELGCGHGRDAVLLAEHGHTVLATDFSPFALSHFPEDVDSLDVERRQLDVTETPYPFSAGSFDAVYAHLSLHYFPQRTTRDIFTEIARVLRPGGMLIALFNSVRDPECGTGTMLEPSYWELSSGDRKRFFTVDEMPGLLGDGLQVLRAEFGRGTRKNVNDEYVLLLAQAKHEEAL